jgi:hypothetical protein
VPVFHIDDTMTTFTKTIPAADYDRIVAVSETYGGVDSGDFTVLRRSDKTIVPCCVIGMAHASGVLNPNALDLFQDAENYFGVGYAAFDQAIRDVQRARGIDRSRLLQGETARRVPVIAVLKRLGIGRGEVA